MKNNIKYGVALIDLGAFALICRHFSASSDALHQLEYATYFIFIPIALFLWYSSIYKVKQKPASKNIGSNLKTADPVEGAMFMLGVLVLFAAIGLVFLWLSGPWF